MNRILLVIGFLVCVFSSFAAEFPTNYREVTPLQVDTTPFPCQAPQGLFASARDTIASLNWLSLGTTAGYAVQWKLKNDSLWHTAEVTQNTYLLRGIKSCSEYEFRVKTFCGLAGTSAYSESKKFKTIGCIAPCTTPREIAFETSENKATFKWAASNSRAYEVQIQDASSNGDWRTEVVTGNSFTALNLRPCTKYLFHVRSICTDATATTPIMYSEWSSAITVATTGCAAPCAAPRKIYYSSTATATVIKWDSTRGATYELQVMGPDAVNWRTISGITRPFYELSGLPNCTIYQARVRVICLGSTSPSPWSYVIRFKTGGCQAVCKTPSALKVNVADSIAVFSWVAPNVSKFVFQYKLDADVNWKSLNVTGNVYILTGLNHCKKYMARIQSICDIANAPTEFSNVVTFETGGCPPLCARPVEIKADIVLDSVAILYWTGIAGYYEIQYRRADWGENDWKSVRVNSPAHKLILESCKGYYWRVRKVCETGVSDWSEIGKFETKGCVPTPIVCAIPTNLKTEIAQDTIVAMFWTGLAGKYEIQYLVAGADSSHRVSITVEGTAFRLPLKHCTGYYWRVRRICDNGFSDWSELAKFETKGCITPNICQVPSLNVNLVSDSLVNAIWLSPQSKFEIQYRIIAPNQGEWISEKFERIYEGKLKLHACQVYEIRVRAICDDGSLSNWSDSRKIETKGCITTPLVCVIPTNLKTEIGQDTIVAMFWTGLAGKYEIQYQAADADSAHRVSLNVEGVAHKLILKRCTGYYWRVRKVCDNGFSEWSELAKFETKGCPVISCPIPTGLFSEVGADTVAALIWAATNNVKYDVQYRVKGSGDAGWVTVTVSASGHKLTGLKRCTTYEWKIRQYCIGAVSDWSTIQYFTTKGCPINNICPAPLDLKVQSEQSAVAYILILWSDISTTDSVFVQYRKTTDTTWTNASTVGTTPNGILLRDLENCKEYKIRARRKCTSGLFSDWSEISYKRAVNCLIGDDVTTNSLLRKSITTATVYPNPGKEYIQVEYDLTETVDVKVQLVNIQGQVVKQLDNSIQDAGNYMQVLDNLSDIQQGLYFIIIRTDGKVSVSQKWMKQ